MKNDLQSECLYLNNKKIEETTIVSFDCAGISWKFDVQQLKHIALDPMVFVFSQENNVWAREFIGQFNAVLSEWVPGGDLPEPEYIVVTSSHSDIQEKLYTNRLLREGKVSYIISIGDIASTEVSRYRYGYNKFSIPHLFCVNGDPSCLDLSDSYGNLLPNASGVHTGKVPTYVKQIRTIKSVMPSIKNMAVVYDSASCFDLMPHYKRAIADQIAQECERQGIKVCYLKVSNKLNFAVDLVNLGINIDAIITLEDTTVYSLVEDLVAFCNKYGILFVSSELVSVAKGAALGFGNRPRESVAPLIELILRHREQQAPLHTFDAVRIENRTEMRHNINGIRKQVRNLSQDKEDLLEMLSIYANH